MQALRLLFTERRATFRGKAVHFEEVECFPKPVQRPLPIYAGGNHPEVRRRAGELCEGWLPAVPPPAEIVKGGEDVRRAPGPAAPDRAEARTAPPVPLPHRPAQ